MTALMVCIRFSASSKTMDWLLLEDIIRDLHRVKSVFLADLFADGGVQIVERGQAVHEAALRPGLRHELCVDLIGGAGREFSSARPRLVLPSRPTRRYRSHPRFEPRASALCRIPAPRRSARRSLCTFRSEPYPGSTPPAHRRQSASPSLRSRPSGSCPCCTARRPCTRAFLPVRLPKCSWIVRKSARICVG